MPMKIFSRLILLLGMTILAVGQSADQIEKFSRDVTAAWESGEASAFESLYCFQGSTDEIRKMAATNWINRKKIKDAKLEIVEFVTLKAMQKRIATGGDEATQLKRLIEMAEENRVINGMEYRSNLKLAGVLIYRMTSNSNTAKHLSYSPVGMNDGALRFPSMRPVSNE